MQCAQIRKNTGVPVFLCEDPVVLFACHREPMPQVIVSDDRNSFPCKIFRKSIVAVDKFHHAVRDLQYGDRCFRRRPLDGVDLCAAVAGCKSEFVLHRSSLISRSGTPARFASAAALSYSG